MMISENVNSSRNKYSFLGEKNVSFVGKIPCICLKNKQIGLISILNLLRKYYKW